MEYEQIAVLNDRSRLFNGPKKAIFIEKVEEVEPYISIRYVNSKSKNSDRMSIMDFIAKLATLEAYAVNIENIREFIECNDVVGAAFSVTATYNDEAGLLLVSVFDALVAVFIPYEIMEENSELNMVQRIVEACRKNKIPIGNGKSMIIDEIKRCIEEEINAKRPLHLDEYAITKWIQKNDDLFTLD